MTGLSLEGDLSSFREAIRREHLQKVEALEKQRDNEIAELIADRRTSVQRRVSKLRKEQEEKYLFLAGEMSKDSYAAARASFLDEFSKIRGGFEETLRGRIEGIRRSERERYAVVLRRLAAEALRVCGRPAVVFVEPQDRDLLSSGTLESGFEDGVEIREENLDGWGGCRAVSENMVVDNTLLARWRRLSPSFSVRLSLLMNDSFSEIHNRISKL
ncbi:MAG: hypothetical protein EOM17_08400 [Synergistales bacterium]|nr:hypothetical protein [Synergistales bacterium]